MEHLSVSVVAICSLLDPEAVVFGGGTSEAGEALLGRIRNRAAPLFGTRLILAGLGANPQLYGALWGALQLAERKPSRSRRLGVPAANGPVGGFAAKKAAKSARSILVKKGEVYDIYLY